MLPSTVKLRPRELAVYRLRFVEGLTQAEVARRCGIRQPAVVAREKNIVLAFRAAGHPAPHVPGRFAIRRRFLRLAGC